MIGIEASWLQFGGEGDMKPRQLFVTRSQHLANKVKEVFAGLHETYVSEYASACTSVDAHGWSAMRALPEKFSELDECHFPVFISFDAVSALIICGLCGTELA